MSLAQIIAEPVKLRIDTGIQDLSGVVRVGDYLVLGNDEGHGLLVCRQSPADGVWEPDTHYCLSNSKAETDIEALTYADGYLYVMGSHSLRRRSLRPERLSVKQNRRRFCQVQAQPSRNHLYRIPFDRNSGKLGEAGSIKLTKRLRKDPFLGPFTRIASKENGVDIEGIAAHRGELYLGFRGPVLRHNMVPVMVLDYAHPKGYRLHFVDLLGQGIRDMVSVGDSLLVLSGPVGDAPGPFRLWAWDGRDQLPGTDRQVKPSRRLGNIEVPAGAKAEGLALIRALGERVDLLVVFDGVGQQRAARISVQL